MTAHIGIIGASGKVGLELALRLRDVDGLSVTAICRTHAGSAYLRLNRVDCVHGELADISQARALLDNCDVVVQLAYRAPRSRAEYRANHAVTENSIRAAAPGAHVLYASTIMVYAPDMGVRVPDAYGMEKLWLERIARRAGEKSNPAVTCLRLGHCLGPLQPQSAEVIAAIRAGVATLPDGGMRPSNTVFVASIADAVAMAARKELDASTYDLVTHPQWTWRDVFAFYASELGVDWRVAGTLPVKTSLAKAAPGRLRGLLAALPEGAAQRAYGLWLLRNAKRRTPPSLGASHSAAPSATSWRGLECNVAPGLLPSSQALQRYALPELASLDELPSGWSDRRYRAPDSDAASMIRPS